MKYGILLFIICCSLSSCFREAGTSEAFHLQTKANGQTDAQPTHIKTDKIELTVPAGYDVLLTSANAKQPTPSDDAAIAKVSDKGAEANSGNGGKTAGDIGLAGTLWIGILLIIVGGVIWLSKKKGLSILTGAGPTGAIAMACARLPKGSGLLVMILGGVVIILPWFLDQIEPLVLPAVTIVFICLFGWWLYNMISERKRDDLRYQAHG